MIIRSIINKFTTIIAYIIDYTRDKLNNTSTNQSNNITINNINNITINNINNNLNSNIYTNDDELDESPRSEKSK